MKIGILTYHRTQNFGANMQAIATRLLFERCGHEVYYIDYWPDYHKRMYALFDWKCFFRSGIRKKYHILKDFVPLSKYRIKRHFVFKTFHQKYINPYCRPYNSNIKYDIVLYGSDQIWRKQFMNANNLNPVYFADNMIQSKRHIAWAASIGINNLTDNDKYQIKNWLSKYQAISARENEVTDLVKSLGYDCETISDPTFMLSCNDWDKIFPKSNKRLIDEKYVLYYPLIEGFDINEIRHYSKKNKLRLITLHGSVKEEGNADIFVTASPAEMLSLIKHAEVVFTSSFHGMVFCILYHKDFRVSFSHNAGRAYDLLISLGLQSAFLATNSKIGDSKIIIEYNDVDKKIKEKVNSTYNFIKLHIGTPK